ncbi:MAG: hypothetical protein KKI08_18535, partial [Armatimonadetes bacterium]|nr:hypothetical protein [Armatimonadota bacterium]
MPVSGAAGWDFVALSERWAALGQVAPDGQLRLQPLPAPQRVAAVLDGRLHVFSDHGACEITPAGEPRALRRFADPVRAVAPAGPRLAVLLGGHWQGGHLRGASVALWTPPDGPLRPAPEVDPAWNPCFLRPAPDATRLLVGVRKPTHFDPVVRLRPFLYRCAPDALVAVWKGTSFARAFEDVVLVDVAPEPGAEACVLEGAADGHKRVTVYTWTGTRMVALAAGPPGLLGHTLQPVGHDALGVFRQEEGGWRVSILRPGNQRDPAGVQNLQEVAAGPILPVAPTAWTTVCAQGRTWLITAGPPDAAGRPELTATQILP